MNFQQEQRVYAKFAGVYEEVTIKKIEENEVLVEDQYTNLISMSKEDLLHKKSFLLKCRELFMKSNSVEEIKKFIEKVNPKIQTMIFYLILLTCFFSLMSVNLIAACIVSFLFLIGGLIYFSTDISFEVDEWIVKKIMSKLYKR